MRSQTLLMRGKEKVWCSESRVSAYLSQVEAIHLCEQKTEPAYDHVQIAPTLNQVETKTKHST